VYAFARGPLVWIAFLIFILGSLYQLISMIRLAKKDKVVLPYFSVKYGLRSLIHWIVPYGSRNMRLQPIFTFISFAFHICLIAVPIFLTAHNVLWRESFGISPPSFPELLTDIMTVIVIAGGVFFIFRRILSPTVRNVTFKSDYLLIAIVLAPFVTGFAAYHQWFDYDVMIVLHIWTGALWLAAIPFTRIVHMIFFFFSRMFMGSEFGAVRNAKDW
jgi:nitrate reductase gamma subunit